MAQPCRLLWACRRERKPASSCATTKGRLIQRIVMRFLTALLALIPTCALAQELSVEDRACITAAANKLPLLPHLESREAERCRNRSSPRDGATRMYIASRWRLTSVWQDKVRPTSLIASVMAK
jgi:hypothetical protein